MDTPTPKSMKSVNKLSARQPVNKPKPNQQQMTTPKKLSSTMNVTPKKLPPY